MTATRTKRLLSIQPVAERGGSDQALLRLVRSLSQDGWDCHIALPARSPMEAEFSAAGATLHVVPMRRITTSGGLLYWIGYAVGWPVAVVRLALLARRLDVGVVHSNSLHSWYGWAVGRVVRRPHVWHAREIVVQSGAALRLERFLTRRYATVVLAASEAVGAQLDGAPVVVAYDSADRLLFGPHRAGRFRAGAGIADETFLVGVVGRIDTWKGIDVALDALERLRDAGGELERLRVELVIAGGTVQGKEAYARSLQDRGIPGVHWLGWRDDIAALVADLDVLVVPSTEPEPFGLGIIEALASGVPVVATAAGGPLEILPPESLVAPGDPEALAAALRTALPTATSSALRRKRAALKPRVVAADFPALFARLLRG